MDDVEFRRLIALLGRLSDRQRTALREVLGRTALVAEGLAIVDAAFAAHPLCGHCGSDDVRKWGRASGLRRYRCQACRRTFNALTGTPLAQLHRRDAWIAYAQALADGVSLRKAAARCGVDLTTAFRWRHRFLEAAQNDKARRVSGVVEVDETYFLHSQKGRGRVSGRRPRRRGGVAAKRGLSDEQVPVLIARDRARATFDAILPDRRTASFVAALAPVVAADAVLVSDGGGGGPYRRFAEAAGIEHIALHMKRGERRRGPHHIQNVNAYASGLKCWISRFRGVATRYLASYLGWWRITERLGPTLTARECLAAALGAAKIST